jgi:hypothetical protein
MMHLHGLPNRKTGPGTRATFRKRAWQLTTLLLLLVLVASPAVAGPLRQDPTPPGDADTGEENEGFIEFGPPNGDGVDLGAAPSAAATLAADLVGGAVRSLAICPYTTYRQFDVQAWLRH